MLCQLNARHLRIILDSRFPIRRFHRYRDFGLHASIQVLPPSPSPPFTSATSVVNIPVESVSSVKSVDEKAFVSKVYPVRAGMALW